MVQPMLGGSQTDSVYYLGTTAARWLGVHTRSINPTTSGNSVRLALRLTNSGAVKVAVCARTPLAAPRVCLIATKSFGVALPDWRAGLDRVMRELE